MEREASQWAADWIIWTHTPAGSTDKFTVAHIPFLFGILPCLPRCSSECLSLPLCYALSVSNYISLFDSPLFFLFSFHRHNNSFLSVCCGSLSFLAALISPNTVVFILSLYALSSLVIALSHFLSVSLPSEISVETSLHLFFCLCITPYSVSSSIPLPCSLLLSFWVTSSILHGVPRDVSVISRSLISKSSSWQRTRHAEEHRHKAWRQLMRPHTPTATITRPLQHQVSSQLSFVRCAVVEPQLNNCSKM